MKKLRTTRRRFFISIGKAMQRVVMAAAAILVAFSTVQAGLFLFLEQRASAIAQEDPMTAIMNGRTPAPLTSQNATPPAPLGVVSEEVRKQAKPLGQETPPNQKQPSPTAPAHKSEDVTKRTENTKTFKNQDGSTTLQVFNHDIAYKDGGTLKEVKTTVSEDRSFQSVPKNVANLVGAAATGLAEVKAMRGTDGPVKVEFTELSSTKGLKVGGEGQELAMLPLDVKGGRKPERSRQDGADTITYKNVWDGVDLVYQYHGDAVKEFIVLSKKPASSSFGFKIPGATLREAADVPGAIDVLKDGKPVFVLPPLTVMVNEKGPVGDSGAKYTLNGDTVTVHLDQSWLKQQNQKAYPIVIDPTVQPHYAKYEVTGGGNDFWAFKSDGYNCPSWSCWMNVGQLQDNGTKYWRSTLRIPFDAAFGKDVHGAALHLYKQMSGPSWYGTNNAARYWVTWAGCNGFHCIGNGAPWMPITIGTEGHADMKPLIDWMVARGLSGGWLMIHADDSPYKAINSLSANLELWYNTPPPVPNKVSPADQQLLTTTMPQLEVQAGDADGDGLSYMFHLYNKDSFTASSGWLSTPRWVVPEGLLEDGGSYRWYAITADPYRAGNWTSPTTFHIDSRSGKDKTQTYDTVGPMSVNLADGNAYTSTSSHSIGALGGNIGITLDYNTPAKSVKGLSATYYNDAGGRREVLRRTDPNINFEWSGQSPKVGTVDADFFAVNWRGYFVAPQTGNYTFGGSHDDLFSMSLDTQRNGQYQTQFDLGCCNGGISWGGQSVYLVAGQAYPLNSWMVEAVGAAYARMWVRTPNGAEQIVPQDWLRSEVKPINENQGLIGKFYQDKDLSRQFKPDQAPFLVERYNYVSANWGLNSPTGYDPEGYLKDNFLVRFSGYLTVPVTGSYTFGSGSDDGQRIFVNGAKIADMWYDHGHTEVWSSPITLQAGQVVPIVLEYYENGGGAGVNLQWNGPAGVGLIGPEYLTTSYRELPAGWSLSMDADGNLPYERLRVSSNGSADLIDGDGTTYTFTWTGSGFAPPTSMHGSLVRNADASFTLSDPDGRVYMFSADGVLTSVTSPVDDRKPAALRYEYQTQTNVPRLKKIIDGVDSARFGELFYGGDSQCATPSGFTTAPKGFLCAFRTYNNQITNFYYSSGKLARVEQPGGVLTDFSTDASARLTSIRDSVANDAVVAGVRTANDSVLTQLSYDSLGRISTLKMPAPRADAARTEHAFEYGWGYSKRHTTGAPQPHGFTQYIEYDGLQRTTKACDNANLCISTQWHPQKDLPLASVSATGQKSTTIYDDDNRAVRAFGPAPAAWFGADNQPLAAYAAQIPRKDTAYDEGLWGPAVAWYDFKNGSLFGAPKLHTTGFGEGPAYSFAKNMANAPITMGEGAEGVGFSATGKLRVIQSGTFNFASYHDDAAKLWINDEVVFDRWTRRSEATDGVGGSRYLEAGQVYRLRFDYATAGTPGSMSLHMTGPGKTNANHYYDGFLTPGYDLVTTETTYDATVGNIVNKNDFGTTPEYGLLKTATLDPTGLNYKTTSTYETPGTNFLRQLTKTMPGGSSVKYTHYGAAATKDNPCTTSTTEAFRQAGQRQKKSDVDPDGSGEQIARTLETIYDDAGRVAANRINTGGWTCTTYDSRGRIAKVKVAAFDGEPARTITNAWAIGGNPLKTSVTDAIGTVTTEIDLLGRTVYYIDVHGSETATFYDDLGRMTTRDSEVGLEEFAYDNFGRLTEQKLDGTILARPFYDSLGRIDHVDYPSGNLALSAVQRDNFGRTSGVTWRFANGSTVNDRVTRSQSGMVMTNITQSGSQELWRTFGYDKASRLVSADIGPHAFRYGFGPAVGCEAGTNANAGKNLNRTSQTVNGETTTYCYDFADRLLSSSDDRVSGVEYDPHGNIAALGYGDEALRLHYDSSDRNIALEQIDESGNGVAMYYDRDPQGRIIGRYKNDVEDWVWHSAGDLSYNFTSSDDTPDLVRNGDWDIIEKYVALPGGVLISIKPQESQQAAKNTFSLSGMTGAILAVANGVGANNSTGNGPANTFAYDPFGNVLPGSANPDNFKEGSYGWAGKAQNITETNFGLQPIQMGARVYLPILGRFMQPDPVDGGGANIYAYAMDPINMADYTGLFWKEVGDFFDKAKPVLAVAGLVACVAATAGVCAGVAVAGAVAAGVAAGAHHMDKTGDVWGSLGVGAASAAFDGAINFVAGKVAGAKEVVRWFGKVGDTTRYYQSLSNALAKKPAQQRLGSQVKSAALEASADKLMDTKPASAPGSCLLCGIKIDILWPFPPSYLSSYRNYA